MFVALAPGIAVAGQLQPADLAEAARQGFRLVINNRPDGEEPGQPDHERMAAAARAAGLAYHFIPMAGGIVTPAMVAQTRAAIDGAGGPVLAFCRSGNRSSILWATARAAAGDDIAGLIRTAADAGYDLRPVQGLLEAAAAAR